MTEGDFLFRESFYESCRQIEDPSLRLAVYDAICEYGVTGKCSLESYPISEQQKQFVKVVTDQIFISVDNTKRRYQKAVENGRKGGLKGGKLGGRGHKKEDRM